MCRPLEGILAGAQWQSQIHRRETERLWLQLTEDMGSNSSIDHLNRCSSNFGDHLVRLND
jgi:hypothetical protein